MRQIFVFEYLTGGGAAGLDAATRDEWLPQGLAMRDALVADLLQSGSFAVSVAVCEAAPSVHSGARAVQAQAGEDLARFVARQAAVHDASWVVAPETAGVLARLCDAVGEARWLGCSAAAIGLTASKRATLRRLAGHGITTPLAFAHSPDTAHWVVKPDDGCGAVDTRRHADRASAEADAAQRQASGGCAVVEPWVEGEPMSLSLCCAHGGARLLSVNHQHIVVAAGGRVSFEGVEIAAIASDDSRLHALRALADAVTSAITGLNGFVGIDLVWHPRCGPVVIEVNPRLTSAYVGLSRALGRDLAAELVATHESTHEAIHAPA
jgi:tyramine---L-glutamate ligase